MWKDDPAQVAKALEEQFFDWQRAVTTKVLSGGGPHDVYATVQVQEAPIQSAHLSFVVTLSRLEGNTSNHWVAIGVIDGSTLTLKNITPRQLITSPVTLEGTGTAYENNAGMSAENATAVMMKVLISPEPGVTLGPVPGPDKVKDPGLLDSFRFGATGHTQCLQREFRTHAG